MIDEGPSRGRRAGQRRARSLSCLVMTIPPQDQEVVGHGWGKPQVALGRGSFMASLHLHELYTHTFVQYEYTDADSVRVTDCAWSLIWARIQQNKPFMCVCANPQRVLV